MPVDGIHLLIGWLVGVVFTMLMAMIVIGKRSRQSRALLAASQEENSRTLHALSESVAQVAVLTERVEQSQRVKDELDATRALLDDKRNENTELVAKLASLAVENTSAVEYFKQRVADLSDVHAHMREAFQALANDAVMKNADMVSSSFKQTIDQFFKLAEKDRAAGNENLAGIMKPLKESLVAVDKKVQELETSRQGAYSGLKEQIEGLLKTQTNLQKETQTLSRALYAPTIRGRWGEMQLRRVVELSGLSPHCDFLEQKNISDGNDVLRPDMIVTLPQNKKIVIDAKAPLYQLKDEGEDIALAHDFVAALKRHLLSLKKKSYHSVLGDSPEFVVMFLPSEGFLHWALVADPMLLDFAAQHEIIIATPITLVALLKAIAFGFKQEAVANNIEEVRRLSEELITRVNKVAEHFEKLGRNLKQATESYNQTLSSLDSRVLVTARKLAQIKSVASTADVVEKTLPDIDIFPRDVQENLLGDRGSER